MSPFDPIQTLVPALSHRSKAAASIHLFLDFCSFDPDGCRK
jgi:hypothetical protein